jgi:hypothetical protein
VSALSPVDWETLRGQCLDRGDSDGPCPICQEDFKLAPQTLLSCSHTFHSTCLRSFERFSTAAAVSAAASNNDGTTQTSSSLHACPICRRQGYEKRLITDGAAAWRHRCATRIQAAFRGMRGRRRYRHIVDTVPPSESARREEFYMRKLQRTTQAMTALTVSRGDTIDALFAECDAAVAAQRVAVDAGKRRFDAVDDAAWETAQRDADERGVAECPICMVEFRSAAVAPSSSSFAAVSTSKACVLLTCSHVFHESCLNSFERFASAGASDVNAADEQANRSIGCPICRAAYQRKLYEPTCAPRSS